MVSSSARRPVLAALLLVVPVLLAAQGPRLKRGSGLKSSKEDHAGHHFLATSAIPLRAGEGWYKNTMVSVNSAAVGLTRNLALSGGVDLFSLFTTRGDGAHWYARAQVSGSPGEIVHLGAQAFYAAVPLPLPEGAPRNAVPPSAFAAGLGMLTIGLPTHQVTLTGGLARPNGSSKGTPLLGLAGMARVGPSLAVVTEHWWFAEADLDYPLHSLGIRVLGDFLALDVGLAYDREAAVRITPVGMPFVAGTLNF